LYTAFVKKVVHAVELLQGIHIYVVEEETLERRSNHVHRRLVEEHHLHDLQGHRVVGPRHNALIDLKPLIVMPHGLGIDGAVDMVNNAKFAEHGIEESAPHAEVVLDEVEDNQNMITNVHMLDGHGGNWSRVAGRSAKWLEEWTEPETDEVGLDAMRGERNGRIV
jgi:hypothetical protein